MALAHSSYMSFVLLVVVRYISACSGERSTALDDLSYNGGPLVVGGGGGVVAMRDQWVC